MPTPAAGIVQLLSVFAVAMSVRTFQKSLVLLYGAILTPGGRTVSAALRVMGLEHSRQFGNFHRVLNRDCWSPWLLSRLLLALIVQVCLAADAPLRLIIDETLERRAGRQIKYKGRFRDMIRSSAGQVVTSSGIRWCVVAILVELPWSQRPWALPFCAVPVLSPKTSARLGKPHRTSVDWAIRLISKIRRWQPTRRIEVVGDATYSAVHLVRHCQTLAQPVHLISRLRLDANLYDPPALQPKTKMGPKPKKGARQPKLSERLADPNRVWRPLHVLWYDGQSRRLEMQSGKALWYTRGGTPVPIRWVLVRCPDGSIKPSAFFSSDSRMTARQIVSSFVARWHIEVTFFEMRAHLGLETQRQWSDRAIERTTPCLFGLFSLLVLMARCLHPRRLPVRQSSWYAKSEATFSDVLAAVRQHLWASFHYKTSATQPNASLMPSPLLKALQQVACYAT